MLDNCCQHVGHVHTILQDPSRYSKYKLERMLSMVIDNNIKIRASLHFLFLWLARGLRLPEAVGGLQIFYDRRHSATVDPEAGTTRGQYDDAYK